MIASAPRQHPLHDHPDRGAGRGIGALVGTFLVLRGSAMLTDAISHSIVLGIVLVWLATGHHAGRCRSPVRRPPAC
jgi:hypothetical protein